MSAIAADLGGVAHGALGLAAAALLHGTVLALIAFALAATVLRRARPGVIAALWTVVLLKFVLPVGPGARYSVASLIDAIRGGDRAPATAAPAPPALAAAAHAKRPAPHVPWGALALGGLWLTGSLVVGARQLRSLRRARAAARTAAPAPEVLAAEVAALAATLGVRPAEVRVSGGAAPYLVGVVRPIVVVPASLCTDERAAARTAALLHELAHIRRGDAALRLLQTTAATLFFFWPLVRWVNRRLDLAREQACDAYAIAIGPLGAAEYARMLVDVARARLEAPAAGLALARKGQLARLIDALVGRGRRPARPGLGKAGVALVAGFGVIGLTGAARPSQAAAARARTCHFTPELASSIMAEHPEADADGDGALSRDEVCEYQLALRRRYVAEALASSPVYEAAFDADGDGELTGAEIIALRDHWADRLPMTALAMEASPLASEDLCCNCHEPAAGGSAVSVSAISTCVRGVDR